MSFSIEQINICKKGNLDDVLSLMNYSKNHTVLYIFRFGRLEIIKYLVENRREDLTFNSWEFWLACLYGHIQVVKYLAEECGINARAENDWPVQCASRHGHLEVVKYLVEKCGADVRANNDESVRLVFWHGHFEVVKYFVEKCGAVLPEVNPKYERYLIVCEKGEIRASKRIYFWWVQACYNPGTLCGQRSMYKGYKEYLSIR